jgi:hypothetical protein
MIEIGLISLQNDEVFNGNLLNFAENYQIRKEKNREKIKNWRDNQDNTKNVTSYEPDCNGIKVKESKVNGNTVNIKDYDLPIKNFETDLLNEFTRTELMATELNTTPEILSIMKKKFIKETLITNQLYKEFDDVIKHFYHWSKKQSIPTIVNGSKPGRSMKEIEQWVEEQDKINEAKLIKQ